MDKIRFGVIGLGNIGGTHMATLKECKGAELTAICDVDAGKRDRYGKQYGVPTFESHQKLIESGLVDAITLCTPHYFHPPMALDGFARGLHVVCEKPVGVGVGAARDLNKQWEAKFKHLKFGMVFQYRAMPIYSTVRRLIAEGELGEVSRITLIVTDQFRTWAYYASGGWRATWEGEGGGVLLNQCPHFLDLLHWVPNLMPRRVTAVASIAKTHPIEVEDDVSAILEYDNGAIGHFICNTGEAPGTQRLEIAGDRGQIVVERNKITFRRTRKAVQEFSRTTAELFPMMETWGIDVPFQPMPAGGFSVGHRLVLQNFVDHVLKDQPLYAHGTEGIHSLEIGNAMLMSGITRKAVELPVSGEAYDAFLAEITRKYKGKKTLAVKEKTLDAAAMAESWKK